MSDNFTLHANILWQDEFKYMYTLCTEEEKLTMMDSNVELAAIARPVLGSRATTQSGHAEGRERNFSAEFRLAILLFCLMGFIGRGVYIFAM